jgi:2-hydroxychromene-2-carboxylate isomerase
MPTPKLYFDLGSPYAYLAVERAERVLGTAPELVPVLLGAIFARRGSGSWARTERRAEGIAEVEARAAAYGLPPVAWPEGWPGDGLQAMRAATWARSQGAVEAFAKAAFRRAFVHGEVITAPDTLAVIAEEAGLSGAALREAHGTQDVKDRLRAETDAAWDAGVRGIPTLLVDGEAFFGDASLEAAAQWLRG